ncbi:MAG: hypothetical protein JJT76_04700 [Clostridiaceae bacterium]|nr:hypothetical protein [Clostridiaceae bacterium]
MRIDKDKVLLFLISILILLLVLFHIPKNINRSFSACLYLNDSNNTINTDITLDLSIHRQLMNENAVKGTITINSMEYRVNYQGYKNQSKGRQSKFNRESYHLIGFSINEKDTNPIHLKASRDFSYIWGNYKHEQLTKGKQMLISAPANNITEALEIANKMFFYDI